MRLPVVLAYLACATIWGTTYFAIRVCIAPGGYPTYLSAALRFVIAALILGGIVLAGWARPGPASRRQRAWLVVAGLLNFGGYTLVYTAEESITGGLAAVIYGTMPLMTAVLTAVTRTERATPAAIAGALISLGGIALIGWDQLGVSTSQVAAVGMMLGSVALSSTYNIIFKKQAQGLHPLAQNAWFLGVTAAAMSLLALAEGGEPPWPPPVEPTIALLYLAIVGSVVAFASYLYLIQHVRLMTSATLVLWQPVIALVVDYFFEAQRIAALSYVGATITIVGVGVNILLGAPAKEKRA